MKKILILLFCLRVVCVFGQPCAPQKFKTNNVIKHSKFKDKFQLLDTTTIRFNGVYVLSIYIPETGKNQFAFCRFFKNGRVFVSTTYCSYPSNDELTDLTYGARSYYIVNEGKIEIERYNGYAGYYTDLVSITGDTLTFSSYLDHGKKKKDNPFPEKYVFKEINIATKPEW